VYTQLLTGPGLDCCVRVCMHRAGHWQIVSPYFTKLVFCCSAYGGKTFDHVISLVVQFVLVFLFLSSIFFMLGM